MLLDKGGIELLENNYRYKCFRIKSVFMESRYTWQRLSISSNKMYDDAYKSALSR